jgi:amidase
MAARHLIGRDATAQLAALQAGQIGALELLKAALARHEQTHKRLNAVIAADVERAVERARAIDDARAKGESLGPLAGLPITIKDTLDVVGMPASAGLEAFRRRRCDDAAAVAHARQAGAVIWGKTNVPVMAADWQSFNALYGTTNNPWDAARTPGGSSGGAAAAVAAGVTALEIGSDIGGSLRVPASFCGVYSHKPTWGMVSQRGHVPPAPGAWAERDLNVIGPLARSARDLRLMLSVIEHGPMAAKAPSADLAGLRVGLWLDAPGFSLDPEVRRTIEAFAKDLAAAGAEVAPLTRPVDVDDLIGAYIVLLASTLAPDVPPAQLARFELMRWPAKLLKALGGGPLSVPSQILAYTARHIDWIAADETRARISHQIGEVFGRLDVILAPVSPTAAYPHDHRPFNSRKLGLSDGSKTTGLAMLQWIALATACRLPVTTVPAGLSASGLPVGVQLIGPRGGDGRLLAIAQAIDENIRGFVAPPEEP